MFYFQQLGVFILPIISSRSSTSNSRKMATYEKCLLYSLFCTFRAWVCFQSKFFEKKWHYLLPPFKQMSFSTISNEKHFFPKLKTLLKEVTFWFYFVACGSNEFKSDAGNQPCKRCGPNSTSLRTSCQCFQNHHRELNLIWDSSSPCYSKFIL